MNLFLGNGLYHLYSNSHSSLDQSYFYFTFLWGVTQNDKIQIRRCHGTTQNAKLQLIFGESG